ncbi:flavodoxin family protein [Acidaminobacter sp. JC074]|uniref:flavodoxin family protein n=1 Tax=Acidaminobacter sp. JC074 TaxID=2530199 RepID=UPI001F0E1CCA|nr:flavodoxin family protein [Acidaminobacter sp. JC074]MCH4889225.1 flavodoxin family protein [Acidaminobacter sp. JC074]
MKVIAINGSPRKKGNTSLLIGDIFNELNESGIETKEVNVGSKHFKGCLACGGCWQNKDKKCVIKNDDLNDIIDDMLDADAIILGSPVYCADVSGQMKTFIDRVSMVACANDDMFKRKLGASITAVRRAGALSAFHTLNSFFTILQMPIISSSYWNMGYGYSEGEVLKDEEGLQTMRNLGKNLTYFLKVVDIGSQHVEEPKTSTEILTNFIR